MSVIAPNGSAVDRTVTVGAGPVEVAVTKNGTAFVTNQYGGTVSVIPAGANTVSRTIQVSSTPGGRSSTASPPAEQDDLCHQHQFQ